MISVIVPIYNAEKYLVECLDSVVSQTYRDLEIVLVDDGSTDGSVSICKSYAQKDKRIKIVSQGNGGSTKARRTGVEASRGEYISFVDSDDWLEPCFYEKLYGLLVSNDADLIVSGCCREFCDRTQFLTNRFEEGLYREAELQEIIYPQMLYHRENGFFSWGILQFLWNKIYKREVIVPCIMNLDDTIYDGEDVACVFDACLRAGSIYVDNHTYYHYRVRENSICTSKRGEAYFANAVRLYEYLKQLFENSEECKVMLEQLPFFMNMFINNGTRSAFRYGYQARYSKEDWALPLLPSEKEIKVCIYGAGKVGISFYTQILKREKVEIVAWVDQRLCGKKIGLCSIEEPKAIIDKTWDYIVIAVAKEESAKEIEAWLAEKGIQAERILWSKPRRLREGYELVIETE